jgi:hypothetical protein
LAVGHDSIPYLVKCNEEEKYGGRCMTKTHIFMGGSQERTENNMLTIEKYGTSSVH